MAVLPLVRCLKLADFTMRYAYTEIPCDFRLFCFLFASMLHYTLLSTQIFCSFSFNFHRFGVGGLLEETFVLAFEIYDSNDHERAGMGSTVVKIIASVPNANQMKRNEN